MTFVSFQHAGRSDIGERKRQEDAYGIKVFQQLDSPLLDANSMELDGCFGGWHGRSCRRREGQ